MAGDSMRESHTGGSQIKINLLNDVTFVHGILCLNDIRSIVTLLLLAEP